jgi:hypothetical protein
LKKRRGRDAVAASVIILTGYWDYPQALLVFEVEIIFVFSAQLNGEFVGVRKDVSRMLIPTLFLILKMIYIPCHHVGD